MIELDRLFYLLSGFILAIFVFYLVQKHILVVDVSTINHNINFDNDCISCKAEE
jgi:hypothetical protein